MRGEAPDEEWLATAPEEEILFPDLPIIDPHHHLWDDPCRHFPYLAADYSADAASGHKILATVHCECSSMYRAFGPEALKPVGETEFVVGQAAICDSGRYGATRVGAGIIGGADLRLGTGVKKVLEAHREAGKDRFKGVRIQANFDASDAIVSSPFADSPDMLMEAAVREGAREVAKMGLVLDIFCFFTQLPQVAALARDLPDLTIVLDHCGGPLGNGPYAQDRAQHYRVWKSRMLEIARLPNVYCKVGGMVNRGLAYDYLTATRAPSSQDLAAFWAPWFEPVIEAFGPGRCMFESNFPVEKKGMGFDRLWNCFKRLTAAASHEERIALFAGTAGKIYRL